MTGRFKVLRRRFFRILRGVVVGSEVATILPRSDWLARCKGYPTEGQPRWHHPTRPTDPLRVDGRYHMLTYSGNRNTYLINDTLRTLL